MSECDYHGGVLFLCYFFIFVVVVLTVWSYQTWPLDLNNTNKTKLGILRDPVRQVIYFMAILLGVLFIWSASVLHSKKNKIELNSCVTLGYIHFGYVFGGLLVMTHSVLLVFRYRSPQTPLARPIHVGFCSVGIVVVTLCLITVMVHTSGDNSGLFKLLGTAAVVTMCLVLLYRAHVLYLTGKNGFGQSLFTYSVCPCGVE
jgi:hypothetical protein